MLLSPRRIPGRYNRQATVPTRDFVRRRQMRRRRYAWERWKRVFHRVQRGIEQLKVTARRFALVFVACLILLILGLLLFSPILEVREIRVQRSDPRIDVEQVQRALTPLFRTHLFFLSSQDVAPMLRKALPDLASASIQKRYPSTLVVRMTLDPIIARLSIEDRGAPALSSGAAMHMADFLTSQGMYVTYLPDQMKAAQQPLIRVVDWGARPTPWMPLLDAAFLLEMRQAEQMLGEQFGQETTERIVYLRAQEFHLKTKTYTLWFDRQSTLDAQFRRYRVFLRSVGAGAVKQYVDLRLADRVVYK
ncbi:FtsQ-type POTRA domain-containing protein [Candidatus Peregrinibacteria bacterium]|nr:FtsQ-type POTRA domain-containing protein [Candidatus Peregrinibacteria bacterium]